MCQDLAFIDIYVIFLELYKAKYRGKILQLTITVLIWSFCFLCNVYYIFQRVSLSFGKNIQTAAGKQAWRGRGESVGVLLWGDLDQDL